MIILNESLARRLFGATNPVGHFLRFDDASLTVVGVARDSKYFTLGEEDRPALYEPYFQPFRNVENLHFIIRTGVTPESLVKTLATTLAPLDKSASIEVKPMKQAMGLALLPSQAGAGLLGSVGLLGLVLAAIGLYGVLVFSVSRRTREIGLRVALGARPGDVLRMVFSEGLWLIGLGMVIGVAVSLLVTRPLTLFLVPGLKPSDPVTYAAVLAVLGAVGFLATLLPTLRALRVDPLTALRHE